MQGSEISRATLGRIPAYLDYIKALEANVQTISATTIARALELGEVQVRKDLSAICGAGRPKVGYVVSELVASLERFLGPENGGTVIIGAGKLGRALLDYSGFSDFGLTILAAFDRNLQEPEQSPQGTPILPMEQLSAFCRTCDVKIGIIAVPAQSAQSVADLLYDNGIRALWCLAPCRLQLPEDTVVQYENMALSLANLKIQIKPNTDF